MLHLLNLSNIMEFGKHSLSTVMCKYSESVQFHESTYCMNMLVITEFIIQVHQFQLTQHSRALLTTCLSTAENWCNTPTEP